MFMFRFKSLILFTTLLPILFPSFANARWSLTPRFYVEGQYDDNIFLTEDDELDDFITTVSPGVNLTYQTPTGEISLDYEFQRSFYNDVPELDFSGHRGRVEGRKDFGPRLGVEITETFIRSEDPVEFIGYPTFERPSIRIGSRNRYTRNIVEPGVIFRFGENRSIRYGYRNQILRNKEADIADFDENALNALFVFRFNIQNGIEVFYEHINLNYGSTIPPEPPRDFDGDEIRGRYTRYFGPRTSVFLQYLYYQRDFDTETFDYDDYRVHNPVLGFSRDLYENVTLSASGGYAFRDAEDQKDEDTFTGRGDLSVRYERLTMSFYGEMGYQEDFTSAESLGFNEFWRIGMAGSYQLLERLWVESSFFVERDKFVDIEDRRDRLWTADGSINFGALRWLFFSFTYEHSERDSNLAFESYRDNRYIGRITAQYDIAERFQ